MRLALHISLVVPLLLAPPDLARGDSPTPTRSVIVKLRAEGPHAVAACAETLSRRGIPLAAASADASDSLDRLRRSLGIRGTRAVFRRPDGSSFREQRRALRDRLRAAQQRRPWRSERPALGPPDLAHVYRMELSGEVDAERAAALLAADPHVEYAQPNYPLLLDGLLNDPFLHSQGSWGQSHPDQWGIHAIEAPTAWDRALGEGVVVAVVDTGVDYNHPDIAPNLWVNPGEDLDADGVAEPEDQNGLDDDGNGFVDDVRGYDFVDSRDVNGDGGFSGAIDLGDADPMDENGHGTHVAGIVAARGDNGLGIAGVAPFATLMPVRTFSPFGVGQTDQVWRGVLYAAENGADVVNGSFSCGRVCRSNPIAEEILGFVSQLGVAYVTSAGNAASDVMLKSPERLRESIVVGSTHPFGGLSASSSFGLLVDVVAPGQAVLSLKAEAADLFYSSVRFIGDDYMRLSGTSMAAPHVSGVLALLLSADPSLTVEDLRLAIRLGARDLGDTGHDVVFGSGLVQPAAALDVLPPPALRGEILFPLPGDTVDTDAPLLPIVGNVAGDDLEAYHLEIGEGEMPMHWSPLATPRAPPIGAGELAHLPLGDLSDGAYVLRLTLVAKDGLELREFTPIGIERSRPAFVSSPGVQALRPDVHGMRVAWESRRDPDGDGVTDLDLMLGTFGTEGEKLWVGGPGDQTDIVLSGQGAVWRELPEVTATAASVGACRSLGQRAPCRPHTLAAASSNPGRPDISGSRIVFRDSLAGEQRLRSCELGPQGCDPARLAEEGPGPRLPVVDGRRLAWWDRAAGGFGLFTCLLDPAGELCPVVPVANSASSPDRLALSESLLVYQDFAFGPRSEFQAQLSVCHLDPVTAECPAHQIAQQPATRGADHAPDVSRGRVVWHGPGSHAGLDIFYCEYDRETDTCPVQRITSDAANQSHASIDGTRVVWQDDRDGSSRIASIELPALAPLPDRRVRVGRQLTVPIRMLDSRRPVLLSMYAPGGGEVDALGARLEQRLPDRARFRWRPARDQTGTHSFTIRATRNGGLYTEETLRVHVER